MLIYPKIVRHNNMKTVVLSMLLLAIALLSACDAFPQQFSFAGKTRKNQKNGSSSTIGTRRYHDAPATQRNSFYKKTNPFVFSSSSSCLKMQPSLITPSSDSLKRKGGSAAGPPPQEPKEDENTDDRKQYWEIGPTFYNPNPGPLPGDLLEALETNTHPVEEQKDLGNGVFLTRDWRRAWYTYESPTDDPTLIDSKGRATYIIDDIEGCVPDDLVGVLYRNGPGKFGVGGDRVQHVLDADGLVIKVTFPPPKSSGDKREFEFQSAFVGTEAMEQEDRAQKFLYRGTFGTGPMGYAQSPKRGLNEDPWEVPLLSKIVGNAFKTNIKNSANTQIISFGGKLLALFEAGLPHRLDPETLETMGEDTLGGILPRGKLPVKVGGVPEDFLPDFIGGAAHTAHPNICPDTGNLVGWHWSQLVDSKALQVTFTEWSCDNFSPVVSKTFKIPNCELAPHDMALTKNCIMLKVNALKMNQLNFLSGLKGPAASLEMDGRSNIWVHVFPRPTAEVQFEPYAVEVPPCFSIHFSHAYEDEETGNLVSMFSGWPPSDAKDFLGAWGGFAPLFSIIPPTLIWKLEMDQVSKTCVDLRVAPGATNVCAEHPLVHPNFTTKKAKYVYAVASNVIGDSTAPCGYCKICVEEGDEGPLVQGERNESVDAWWFGTRYFAGEPLIVPKYGGDPHKEEEAYLLGMVQDCVKDRSAIAIFDLEKDLREGPVAMMWLKSSVPHGLHGCFAQDDKGSASVFC